MSEAKSGLVRDGTMQVTAKEGIEYLKSQGKETLLKVQGLADDKASAQGQDTNDSAATARDEENGKKADDATVEKKEEPPAKKTKLAKDNTMAATAKEGKTLLAGEKLGDTRQETATQKSRKAPLKKNSTIAKTVEEAKFVLDGDVDVNSGRKTRSQSRGDAPKPAVKKAGTMQKTAKEGKEFLSRNKGKKGKAAAETAAAVEEDPEGEKSDS
ncbi:unnamed protein product [Candidula unifasciata]|uniref:Uncharacterized protein n=1 Tax=Candidula unifasciata TaxID=100452 RepID=A0A8S3YPV0_9EUPU|nr:unnamed protein product [Candidula unifasciata]